MAPGFASRGAATPSPDKRGGVLEGWRKQHVKILGVIKENKTSRIQLEKNCHFGGFY